MVLASGPRAAQQALDYRAVTEHAGRALAGGIDPSSPAGQAVLGQIVPQGTPPADREQLLRQLETFTDERVERYWQLAGILNGQPPFTPAAPAFRWLIAALRADKR
jgi:hypothetical protein